MNGAIISFFESTLPRLLAQNASAHCTMSIIVEGAGAWTLYLGDDAHVENEPSLDADLVVVFDSPGFDKLIEGEHAAPLSLIGNAKLLEHLGRLLMPAAQNPLAARFAGASI